MTFNNLKDHIRDIENVFDLFKDNLKDLKTHPIDCKEDLHRENELLKEIEDLKNQLLTNKKENIPIINHSAKQNEEVLVLKEKHRQEIIQHEFQLLTYKNKIKELNEVIKAFKKEIMDLKGDIRVFCRIKPLYDGPPCDLYIDDSSIRLKKENKDNLFNFDKVFDGNTSQQEVYKEIEGIVESVFEGYKACLFAYGQTGSGKTYTIIGDKDNPGILNRALENITRVYTEYIEDGWKIDMKISCIEIYNEEIYDLLGDQKNKINIIHLEGAAILQNCTEIDVKGDELENAVNQGLIKRRLGSTMSNSQSSRSHTIFILKLKLERKGEVRICSLCLVDLAGSERLDKSKSEGKRLKETQNINRSLSCLGDVFMAILNKDSYVPFRNSKLTYFLQDYLSGDSRVSIVLNISQEEKHYHETLCTLRFGSKVSECKLGKVTRNILKQSYKK